MSLVKSINNLTDIANDQNKRISDLEDINKNSRNSHKPSSTDSPYKDKKKKKYGTTLNQVPNPDKIVKLKVCLCGNCQAVISNVTSCDVDKRQVTDIPPIQTFITEYQGDITECPFCHKKTTAVFPQGVTHKAQYGNNIQAMAVYLRNFQLITLNRSIQLFRDLFKVSISEGSLVNMTTRCANRLMSGFMVKA